VTGSQVLEEFDRARKNLLIACAIASRFTAQRLSPGSSTGLIRPRPLTMTANQNLWPIFQVLVKDFVPSGARPRLMKKRRQNTTSPSCLFMFACSSVVVALAEAPGGLNRADLKIEHLANAGYPARG
jgi:hypothetical protein